MSMGSILLSNRSTMRIRAVIRNTVFVADRMQLLYISTLSCDKTSLLIIYNQISSGVIDYIRSDIGKAVRLSISMLAALAIPSIPLVIVQDVVLHSLMHY